MIARAGGQRMSFDRESARVVMLLAAPVAAMAWATVAIGLFGLAFEWLFVGGDLVRVFAFMVLGFTLVGFTYGPIGAYLAGLFPAPVRYSGTSLAFNLSGILGASLAPYAAMWLAGRYGLQAVGWYLTVAAALTLLALLGAPRLRDDDEPPGD